jgi:hypothetical protein
MGLDRRASAMGFRFALNSGHRTAHSACPRNAKIGSRTLAQVASDSPPITDIAHGYQHV